MTDALIAKAVALLRAGQLVVLPTETVYGLGADALNPVAVARIFALKGRPAEHPLIVHLPPDEPLENWAAAVPPPARALARAFWPGPLTMILARGARVPRAVTGGQDTVALRVPDHPLALALLRAFGSGIAAPSANRFGHISPTTAAHVRDEFGAAVPLILDGGPCRVGIESTIVDLSRGAPVVLRPGAIGAADIARVIGSTATADGATAAGSAPRVSGLLARHYAPRTPAELVVGAVLPGRLAELAALGQTVGVLALGRSVGENGIALADDPAAYGQGLYAALRALDRRGFSRLLIEAPPRDESWRAVNDRLQRAVA
ncbi:L-threonylcarbamoyladenylate synthase [Immundisolibacter cernigliae]|uniref:Threonylcarbamoyl-AMP synthase n=1 Tax=Immundisolibacter cernigliae TaxID=1810504 RepID=A0A1B1YRP5_9GAMM|nr:L-threonylcarbamoyladenylate synthase [Immundisolibacter cernigliae]ANX03357.1 translation factor Sua5 [Immundisolibacter cernigliae]